MTGGKSFYAANLAKSLGMMAVQAVSVNWLGLERFGEATFLLSIPLFVTGFVGMVFGELVVQLFSDEETCREDALASGYRGLLRREALYLVPLVPAVAGALAWIGLSGRTTGAGALAMALLMVPASFGMQTNYTLLLSKFRYGKAATLAWMEALLLPAFLVLPWAWGVPGYVGMLLAKSLAVSGASFLLVRGETGAPGPEGRDVHAVRMSLKHQHSSLAVKAIWSNLDVTVMGFFSGSRLVAEYRIIKSLVNLLPTAVQPVWNLLKPKVLEKARTGDWNEVQSRIIRIAGVLSLPLIAVSAVGAMLLDPVVSAVYGFEPSPGFRLIFWFCFVSTAAANVLTGWSRFLAVVRNDLKVSLNLNLFLAILLAASPIGQVAADLPIPIQLSLGTLVATGIWWRWLFAIR